MMVAFGKNVTPLDSSTVWKTRFRRMLPEIQYRARHAFQGVNTERLEELVNEVIERAFCVFVHLAQRGKGDIVYARPRAIAAIEQVRRARRQHAAEPL